MVVGLLAAASRAHDADVIYASLRASEGGAIETLTMTSGTLLELAKVDLDGDRVVTQDELVAGRRLIEQGVWADMPLTQDGAACALRSSVARLGGGFIELEGHFGCSGRGALRQDFRWLRVLPQSYRVALGDQAEGERAAVRTLQLPQTSVSLPRVVGPGELDGAVFFSAVTRGLRESSAPEVWLSLLLVVGSLRQWRRSARVALVMALSVPFAVVLQPPAGFPVLLVPVVAVAAVVVREPPVVLGALLGLALGAGLEGGSVSVVLGSSLSAVVALGLVWPIVSAVGFMLARRARPWRVVKGLLALMVLASSARGLVMIVTGQ